MPETEKILLIINDKIAQYKIKKKRYSLAIKSITLAIAVIGALASLTSILNFALKNSLLKDVILIFTTITISILSTIMSVFDIPENLTKINVGLSTYNYLFGLVERTREKLSNNSDYDASKMFSETIKDILTHYISSDADIIEIENYVKDVRAQSAENLCIDESPCPVIDLFPQIMEFRHIALSTFHIFIHDSKIQTCPENKIPEIDLRHIKNLDFLSNIHDFVEMSGHYYAFEGKNYIDSKTGKNYYIILFLEIPHEVFVDNHQRDTEIYLDDAIKVVID